MRGDPPLCRSALPVLVRSTPHARGSTPAAGQAEAGQAVYPACAGIHHSHPMWSYSISGLPRMRGDPPGFVAALQWILMSTPHARGSTLSPEIPDADAWVYPACAGIHPSTVDNKKTLSRLPRMRGDPPKCTGCRKDTATSTPHARGSTSSGREYHEHSTVYPACAGIHPRVIHTVSLTQCLPRMRGDPPPY